MWPFWSPRNANHDDSYSNDAAASVTKWEICARSPPSHLLQRLFNVLTLPIAPLGHEAIEAIALGLQPRHNILCIYDCDANDG